MTIYMYLFEHDHWKDLYVKNCSLKTSAEWYAAGHSSLPLGIIYTTLGIVCMIVYIPFMIAMLKPEFIKHSCYKFMFAIGVIDLFVVPCNAIVTGVQCALGMHFCHHPAFFFWTSCIACAGFYGVCTTCVVLAVDRFLEMCFPKVGKKVFGGKRIYFWLLVPPGFYFQSIIRVPFMYNNRRFSYFSDPFVGIEGMQGNPAFFQLTFHCIHNISVGFLLGFIYLSLLAVLKIRTMVYHQNLNITKLQKLLTLQAMCICIEMFIAAWVYVYNQFLPLPNFIEVVAQISWIGVHGDTPIVYLIFNESLRNAVFKMIGLKKSSSIVITTIHTLGNENAPNNPTNSQRIDQVPQDQ